MSNQTSRWPSVAAKQRFEADPRFAPLRGVRDSMPVTFAAQVYLKVKETVTVPRTPRPRGFRLRILLAWDAIERLLVPESKRSS